MGCLNICLRDKLLITGMIAVLALVLALAAIICSIININNADNRGMQAELNNAGGEVIANNSNVIFNHVLNDQSENISYNSATGEFTITEPGNYEVAWWTAPDGAGPAANISFAVAVNGIPYAAVSSPIVSVQMAGNALVTVESVPATLSLVNVTGEAVLIPNTPVQSGIVIKE
ncbi:MAG: hypothetical protein QM697_00190 [Lachnospiraceae bacterium]